MAVPTISRLWRYLFSMARRRQPARNTGADHGCASFDHNTEHSPYGSNAKYNSRKRNLHSLYMPRSRCLFGKFSDVARANRLEADLLEVNLPLRCEDVLGQSLGCRREVDRPTALTADGLIAALGVVLRFYSDASTEDRPAAPTAKGLKSA